MVDNKCACCGYKMSGTDKCCCKCEDIYFLCWWCFYEQGFICPSCKRQKSIEDILK